MLMKNAILLFALSLLSISLTNCSRGYGCPYGMNTELQPINNEKTNDFEDASFIVMHQEDCENTLITE